MYTEYIFRKYVEKKTTTTEYSGRFIKNRENQLITKNRKSVVANSYEVNTSSIRQYGVENSRQFLYVQPNLKNTDNTQQQQQIKKYASSHLLQAWHYHPKKNHRHPKRLPIPSQDAPPTNQVQNELKFQHRPQYQFHTMMK